MDIKELAIELVLDISKDEAMAIYKINKEIDIIKGFKLADIGTKSENQKNKDMDRQIAEKLRNINSINARALKKISWSVGINTDILNFVRSKDPNAILKLNLLQLYELRGVIIDTLGCGTKEYDTLESVLNKVQNTLTWKRIKQVGDYYYNIELDIYRKIVTKVTGDELRSSNIAPV